MVAFDFGPSTSHPETTRNDHSNPWVSTLGFKGVDRIKEFPTLFQEIVTDGTVPQGQVSEGCDAVVYH